MSPQDRARYESMIRRSNRTFMFCCFGEIFNLVMMRVAPLEAVPFFMFSASFFAVGMVSNYLIARSLEKTISR